MAKGRTKTRKSSSRKKQSRPRPPAAGWGWQGIVFLLLALAAMGYFAWPQISPQLSRFSPPAPTPPDGLALQEQTLDHLRGIARLTSLRVEKIEHQPRAGISLALAHLSFDNETEIILAEKAVEEFWQTRQPPLQVDAAYPEDEAGGAVLLVGNRQGAPLLAVRITQREPEPALQPPEPPPRAPAENGRLAIVIDDLGNSQDAAEKLAALDAPITLAVLPYTPYAAFAAETAAQHGKEVILHMPMEPLPFSGYEPGPGALLLAMSPAELESALLAALDEVPDAACVNNHMGSALTEDPAAMAEVMRVLKAHHLCFLDSRTSAHSVALDEAERAGIACARRDVFLDNDRDLPAIRRRLLELTKLAHRQGRAVGIGHPYPETIQVLTETLPKLKTLGYKIVPLSELANEP